VRNRREKVRRGTAHALGRAVGGDQRGELGLQSFELPDQPVVVEVGDLRLVQDVV